MGGKKHLMKRNKLFRTKIEPLKVHHADSRVLYNATYQIVDETRAQHVYGRLRLFLIISEIFLCAPAGAHIYKREETLVTRNCLLTLHLVWCVAAYILLFGCIYYEYANSNVVLPVVLTPLRLVEYAVYTVHVLHIAVGSYCARTKYTKFIQSLLMFDQQLEAEFDISPNYQKLTKFLRKHLAFIAVHIICMAIADFYYTHEQLLNFAFTLVEHMLPNMVFEISLIQYYTLLHMIALRSFELNRILQQQLDRTSDNDQNDKEKMSDPIVAIKPLDNDNLQFIRYCYAHLERLTHEVNGSFGISLMLCYVGSFTNLSINVFLIYNCIDRPTNYTWSLLIYSILWSVMNMVKMFLILYYNDDIQQQKSSTAVLLNNYNSHSNVFEETITHFILQLTTDTRSNVVCGVAALDMDFITSILGTLSMMFIFLLQYSITYEALNVVHKP